jgi:hypothetical protein
MFWRKKEAVPRRVYYVFDPQPDITTHRLAVVVAWFAVYSFGSKVELSEKALSDPGFSKHFTRVDP